jgi:hypothetical protein
MKSSIKWQQEATQKLIQRFLNFVGDKTHIEFGDFLLDIRALKFKVALYSNEYDILQYFDTTLTHGHSLSLKYDFVEVAIDKKTLHRIELYKEELKTQKNTSVKGNNSKKTSKNGSDQNHDLGKIVDDGKPPKGRADAYWEDKLKVIFTPNNKAIRTGASIPQNYDYSDPDFIKAHYNLKSLEFGNWLSQQDRKNYIAALGLALFDLSKVLNFNPKQLSLNGKLSISFGARGRGAKAAHFESNTYSINFSRYTRPAKGSTLEKGFKRTSLLLSGGGLGSLAHEFAHALDYYGGEFLQKTVTGTLSSGDKTGIRFDKVKLKQNNIEGIVERILYKLIWKTDKEHTPYFMRLKKSGGGEYFFRREEHFARAFESYIHLRLTRKKQKNIFLIEAKYDTQFYLNSKEIAKLSKDFDELISLFRKKV